MSCQKQRYYETGHLLAELLESRRLLTSIAFTQHEIYSTARHPGVAIADLDGDLDLDLIVSSASGKLAWYENIDGLGTFGKQNLVDSAEAGFSVFSVARFVDVRDLDGDGDSDILAASADGVGWYENTNGRGEFGPKRLIDAEAVSAVAGDLDGDDDVDLLLRFRDKVMVYDNIDGLGEFVSQQSISVRRNCRDEPHVGDLGDLDGDGDLDLMISCEDGGQFKWYPNANGLGIFTTTPIVSDGLYGRTESGDLDGDGDLDLLSEQGWFENANGQGKFVLAQETWIPHAFPADVDGDGDLDVLHYQDEDGRGFFRQFVWRENTNGLGTYGKERVISNGLGAAATIIGLTPTPIHVGDLDGDGALDVVVTSVDDKIAWYRNSDGQGTFGKQQPIVANITGTQSVSAGDIDGDGDIDALSASIVDGEIVWYENTDSHGTYGEPSAINRPLGTFADIEAKLADIDHDGDLDVYAWWRVLPPGTDLELLFVSEWEVQFVWIENLDGNGNFGNQNIIDRRSIEFRDWLGLPTFETADIDGDGDTDLIVADHQGVLSWYENVDGDGSFSDAVRISTKTLLPERGWDPEAQSIQTVDIDGDGDRDVLASGATGLFWLENDDRARTWSVREIIPEVETQNQRIALAADIDADGDFDVAVLDYSFRCSSFGCTLDRIELSWRENADGRGHFGEAVVIYEEHQLLVHTNRYFFSSELWAVDVDSDGDVDLVTSMGPPWDGAFAWVENGANNRFQTRHNISVEGVVAIAPTDVDQDADLDFLATQIGIGGPDCGLVLSSRSCNNEVVWYESSLVEKEESIPGDSDGNGEVTFADFLLLAQNFGKQVDAVWAEGDFNGDGKVEFADFLILAENFGKTSLRG